jgi:hypothetical protein
MISWNTDGSSLEIKGSARKIIQIENTLSDRCLGCLLIIKMTVKKASVIPAYKKGSKGYSDYLLLNC